MSGETITGRSAGIVLSNPATQNPLTVTATGDVYGNNATLYSAGYGVRGNGYAWTIDNQGIIATPLYSYGARGIDLREGGIVVNGSPGNPAASIAGAQEGIVISGASGNVTNYGLIFESTRGFEFVAGVNLFNGGIVTNQATGVILAHGSGIVTEAASTVVNNGTIKGAYFGVELMSADSSLTNAGLIQGGNGVAVSLAGHDHLVIDPGAVFVGAVSGGAGGNTLELGAGSATGTISGIGDFFDLPVFAAIEVDAGATWAFTGTNLLNGATIDSAGSVINSSTLSGAVVARLETGGAFTNTAAGVVNGTVYGVGGSHNVTNLGTIVGYSNGVGLGVGGTFTNGSASDTTAFVSGYYGVLVDRAAGTVANYGTIVGRSGGGAALEQGGSVTNGSAADTTASITGQKFGVGVFGASGSVTNFATISGTGSGAAGIKLGAGGTVTNQAGGLISGVYGVDVFGDSASVSNAGRIGTGAATEEGVFLAQGGSISNAAGASISAMYGVLSDASATLSNYGALTGTKEGVVIEGTGTITNAASASIAGTAYGVEVGVGSVIQNFGKISASAGPAIATYGSYAVDVTLVNAGTIAGTGGVAVDLAGGASRVVIDPGAVFKGAVVAQGTGNTLELAAGSKAGSISGIGSSFTGFNIVAVDPSASWSMTGHNTLGANATIVTGPTGKLTVSGSLQAAGDLTMFSSGTLVVGSLGMLEVGNAGGTKTGSITIDAGRALTTAGNIKASVVDNGSFVIAGSTTVTGSLTGSGSAVIDPGTVLDVTGQLGLARISFAGGSNATLAVGTPGSVTSTISGFGTGDSIDLLHKAGTSASFFDNVLTVSNTKGVIAALDFSPGYSAANFALASDHHGGTVIGFVPS